MAKSKYLTAPTNTDKMPAGIPYIVGNEAAERFSYYGMKTILVIFLTQYLRDVSGNLDVMDEATAKAWYHNFLASAYFFPVMGALISDLWLGKYRTIILLSIVYCLGHLVLALFETREGVMWGLALIAIGAGGIKPCVTAHVGDQFGKSNSHLINKVFGWFYWSINFGAFISTILTPILLVKYGSHWAFGVPGILMFLATIVFWMGRHKFVHIPADPKGFKAELSGSSGLKPIFKLVVLYIFISMFWAVYEQNGSEWVLQAKHMDLRLMGMVVHPAQIQAINPILVLIYIPLFSYVIYPAMAKFFPMTPARKVAVGLLLVLPVLAVVVHVENLIQDHEKSQKTAIVELAVVDEGAASETGDDLSRFDGRPSILWHILAYTILTAAEVMIYQTGLEYAYTQAPKALKSFMMSFYLLSVSLGNFFTAGVNKWNDLGDGLTRMNRVEYNMFFFWVVLGTASLFIIVSLFGVFKEKNILQDESTGESDS